MPRPTVERRPLSVAVLIDLAWQARAGGHLLSWQRLAEAAARLDLDLDLQLHVQGEPPRTVALGPHVRFVVHRPVLSTARFGLLDVAPDHADLAPLHPSLYAALGRVDVVHTTDAWFAYARTARARARRSGTPLVSSLHTDVPSYTRHYAAEVFRRLGPLGARAAERWRLPERLAAGMERRLAQHLERSAWVLVGERPLPPALERLSHRSVLRRGVDRVLFTPARRDRARLEALWAVPPGRVVLLFAGRLDEAKRVGVVAEVAAALLARGHDVQAVFAGEGGSAGALAARLGPRATLTGSVSQAELASLYASSDLFVFPSEIEVAPNVVLEAKASGLPVLVAPAGGGSLVRTPGEDGLVVDGPGIAPWIEALEPLLLDPARRAALGRAARAEVEARRPTWEDVLRLDLLPVWRAVAKPAGPREDGA